MSSIYIILTNWYWSSLVKRSVVIHFYFIFAYSCTYIEKFEIRQITIIKVAWQFYPNCCEMNVRKVPSLARKLLRTNFSVGEKNWTLLLLQPEFCLPTVFVLPPAIEPQPLPSTSLTDGSPLLLTPPGCQSRTLPPLFIFWRPPVPFKNLLPDSFRESPGHTWRSMLNLT